MPLVSIVLPTFNGEKYISQSIESCLAQTFHDFELVVVNDCSSDLTRSIVEKYIKLDNRIKLINNKVNERLPRALNIGFEHAAGDFLTWTSDDNFYAPHALETLVQQLSAQRDIDIVYSSYQFIDEKGKVLEQYGDHPENLLFSCIIGACFLYRKEVHSALGGYSIDKYRMEDMDFWLRAAAKFKFMFIDGKNLYFYRKHSDSLTSGIYNNGKTLAEYRLNYCSSLLNFFNEGLNADFSQKDVEVHLTIFFEDSFNYVDPEFDLSDRVLLCLRHLDNLSKLNWRKVHFDKDRVCQLIEEKKRKVIQLVINNLVFCNKILSAKNPKLAFQLGRPVSWYYQEYEVLPGWFKKIGHLIKILQGNKSIPFIKITSLLK